MRSLHADELRDVHDTLARERRRLEMLTSNGSALMSELEDKKAALRRHDDEMRQYKRSLAQAEVEVQQGKNARSIVEAQVWGRACVGVHTRVYMRGCACEPLFVVHTCSRLLHCTLRLIYSRCWFWYSL